MENGLKYFKCSSFTVVWKRRLLRGFCFLRLWILHKSGLYSMCVAWRTSSVHVNMIDMSWQLQILYTDDYNLCNFDSLHGPVRNAAVSD